MMGIYPVKVREGICTQCMGHVTSYCAMSYMNECPFVVWILSVCMYIDACIHAYMHAYDHADTRAFEQTHIEKIIPARIFKCNLPSHPWDTHYQFSIKLYSQRPVRRQNWRGLLV